MKKMKRTIGAVMILLGASAMLYGQSTLPKVKIMGKTFYYYESKKGETLAEIAGRNGWDMGMLERTNPEVAQKPDAGTLIYYPVPKGELKTDQGKQSGNGTKNFTHHVKSGETVYGIARQYNTTVDQIFSLNPRLEQDGLKKGSDILIPLPEESVAGVQEAETEEFLVSEPASTTEEKLMKEIGTGKVTTTADFEKDMRSQNGKYIFHTVGEEESLYGIARKYETSIEEIFKVNPGLGAGSLTAGSIIRIPAERKVPERYTETVEESNVESLTHYKVKRGDSWGSIAEAYNIPEDVLREANPEVTKPEKGDVISIPVITTVEIEKEFIAEDPREKNVQGVQELYNEVHSLSQSDQDRYKINETPTVGVAVILTDVGKTADEVRSKHNKEMEFSRGAITAVDAMKMNPYKTRLTILDGSQPEGDITSA
ncbi:MAG: LysM peptidoglycan-binding domain-containing protein, partial [Muribaculaceae bacterium]|nr:LysM peptidoglycan-binding domain-containing protein [Muribaculaceae bacterium]